MNYYSYIKTFLNELFVLWMTCSLLLCDLWILRTPIPNFVPGIATSIQPITVIVPVKTEAETSVNANAYSMCRQLSYATTLIFAFMYTYLGWSFLCVFTVVLLLLAMAITFNVEKVF